jgi:hypothetical protein
MYAVHRGIWVPTQHLLWGGGKPRKILIELVKTEILLYNIYRFSPYLTGNTLHLRYKDQPVNAVYYENHTEHTDTLCG